MTERPRPTPEQLDADPVLRRHWETGGDLAHGIEAHYAEQREAQREREAKHS